MTQFTRRTFLKTSSLAVAAASLPYRSAGASVIEQMLAAQDLRALTAAALDAAKQAGAIYADAHYRLVRHEDWPPIGVDPLGPSFNFQVGFSVRALVNGYWGFAGMDGVASMDDAARLGRDATGQAKTSSKGRPRTVDLAPPPTVANGSWTTPIEIDPFTVSFEEKADFVTAVDNFVRRQRYGISGGSSLEFFKEERTFASTEGAFTTQTLYTAGTGLNIFVPNDWLKEEGAYRSADFLTTVGGGWEYVRSNPFKEHWAKMVDEAMRARRKKPVDVGRYDLIFDARSLANIVSQTVGGATELDRAFGYEANTIGTSYLNDPEEMLGTFKVGSPLLNVTANRSMKGGTATVKWDSEGVEPTEISLVKDGVLNDFQTTRESASWISAYYNKKGMSVRSNGCSGMYGQTTPPTQVNPNFVMAPGKSEVSLEDMIKDTKKGLLILGGYATTDFQVLNGAGQGSITYEIVDGKLGSAIGGAQYLFRAPDFWKNLVAVGGPGSAQQFAFGRYRTGGRIQHTVSAVHAKVTGVAVTDVMRKA